MSLLEKGTGFEANSSLKFFQVEEANDQDLARKSKIFYIIEKISGLLDLPNQKEKQAKDMYGHVNDKQFDSVILGAALVYIAANSEPIHPRWKKLVADKCHQLANDEGRVVGSYNRVYWKKKLNSAVQRLKKREDLKKDKIRAVEHMNFISNRLDLSESVENFCIRKISILFMDPEHQSKSRVLTAGALVLIGQQKHQRDTSKHFELKELAEDLCMDYQTLQKYTEELQEVV